MGLFIDLLPFAILGTSLLGSVHCVAMCGGLVVSVCRSKRQLVIYHIGRLVGYCSLGALAGFLGFHVFQAPFFHLVPGLAGLIIGSGLVLMGVQTFRSKPIYLFRLPKKWLMGIHNFAPKSPWVTGLLSALLPCGWLHTFVVGAVATRSPWLGLGQLFFFWLGTLPLLIMTSFLGHKLFRSLNQHAPKISGLILIGLGLFSIVYKSIPIQNRHSHCNVD